MGTRCEPQTTSAGPCRAGALSFQQFYKQISAGPLHGDDGDESG